MNLQDCAELTWIGADESIYFVTQLFAYFVGQIGIGKECAGVIIILRLHLIAKNLVTDLKKRLCNAQILLINLPEASC